MRMNSPKRSSGSEDPQATELARKYREQAIEVLQQAIEAGFTDLEHIRKDPDLDPIRDHPGFKAILNEGNKVDEERESKVSPRR